MGTVHISDLNLTSWMDTTLYSVSFLLIEDTNGRVCTISNIVHGNFVRMARWQILLHSQTLHSALMASYI